VDPAKPLIRNRASSRLDSGDADVVQIIHATSKYGDLKRMGHVDFCLNGGHVQPFCSNSSGKYVDAKVAFTLGVSLYDVTYPAGKGRCVTIHSAAP